MHCFPTSSYSLSHTFSLLVSFFVIFPICLVSYLFLAPTFLCINLFGCIYLNCYQRFMGSKDPVLTQTRFPLKMNTHKVKGLLKGLRYISQVFEEEKKQELQIGAPTDVKHVSHFGYDGTAQESPSWMRGFGTPTQGQSSSSTVSEASNDGAEWVSEDAGHKMSRRERQEKHKPRHRRHRSVENAPDPDSQTKSRQPRRHHTRAAEGRRAQDESLPEVPKRTQK